MVTVNLSVLPGLHPQSGANSQSGPRIESLIGKKLPAFPTQEEEVMMLVERVSEAQRFARLFPVALTQYSCMIGGG
ncbi:hypothetical protein CCH79_00014745 [Gambusia affinis]|uniref:Uncharacterized protein n=1 Tax=Gambusia affinis TaxID=33528 RepID=A0A315UVK4_GAMAF|nr:hypothetical protein CCH79_00014745 [Gambusia affinis]